MTTTPMLEASIAKPVKSASWAATTTSASRPQSGSAASGSPRSERSDDPPARRRSRAPRSRPATAALTASTSRHIGGAQHRMPGFVSPVHRHRRPPRATPRRPLRRARASAETRIRDGAPAAISRARSASRWRRALALLPRPTVARMPICGQGSSGAACHAANRSQAACSTASSLFPRLLGGERGRDVGGLDAGGFARRKPVLRQQPQLVRDLARSVVKPVAVAARLWVARDRSWRRTCPRRPAQGLAQAARGRPQRRHEPRGRQCSTATRPGLRQRCHGRPEPDQQVAGARLVPEPARSTAPMSGAGARDGSRAAISASRSSQRSWSTRGRSSSATSSGLSPSGQS